MNKNLIIGIVAVAFLFIVWKMMQANKSQTEILKSHTDILMAVAIQTGALKPAEKEKQVSSKKEKTSAKQTSLDNDSTKNNTVVLSASQKRITKLFDDEIPKTAGQLRVIYNKTNTPLDTKKFNTSLWNLRANKGVITYEKLEDSDNVWGLAEWFEKDGDNVRLQDEFFNKIKKA